MPPAIIAILAMLCLNDAAHNKRSHNEHIGQPDIKAFNVARVSYILKGLSHGERR